MSSVDVIIPCYNYGRFLRECVESVLSQEGVKVRALILDDCSPDNTPEVASALAAQDPRIEYRRHSTNHGHIATYNEGIQWAQGDYLVLLSADDLLTPGALSRATRLLDVQPDVGFVHGQEIPVYADTPLPLTCPDPGDYTWRVISGLEFVRQLCTTGENCVHTPTVVVRTRLQKSVGGYRKELPHAGDMEMWLRFAVHASVGHVQTYQAFARRHGQNMRLGFMRALGDMEQRKLVYETLFREYSARIPDSVQLEEAARRALAQEAFWEASRAADRGATARCREFLDFAVETYPAVCQWPPYSRLQWKRRLGPHVWPVLCPLVDWLRGRAGTF